MLAVGRAAAMTAPFPLPTVQAYSGRVFAVLAHGLVTTMLAKRVRRALSAVLQLHFVLAKPCAAVLARVLVAAVLAEVLRAAYSASFLAAAVRA